MVLPCASMMSSKIEENALNILDHDLRDIINASYLYETGNLKARDYLENNSRCNACRYRYRCLGGCWLSARFVAPNGHDVGCTWTYYMDNEVGKTLFMKECKDICFVDGKPHDINERQYCGDGHYRVLSEKRYINSIRFSENRQSICRKVPKTEKWLSYAGIHRIPEWQLLLYRLSDVTLR